MIANIDGIDGHRLWHQTDNNRIPITIDSRIAS